MDASAIRRAGGISAAYRHLWYELRVLRELTNGDEARFPLAVPVMRQQTYVDDVLVGGESIGALLRTRDDVVGHLKGGGFRHCKWARNSSKLLEDLDEEDHGLS